MRSARLVVPHGELGFVKSQYYVFGIHLMNPPLSEACRVFRDLSAKTLGRGDMFMMKNNAIAL